MNEKILIVDDEKSLVESLEYALKKDGYQVLVAGNGLEALEKAREAKPDLVVLDVMLPGMDGLEVCRRLRNERAELPILLLTARDEEIDRVVGLELGADDYVTKPFSLRELTARIKAQLRRLHLFSNNEPPPETMQFGPLRIASFRREVFRGERKVELTPKEFDLLLYLARHPDHAMSRDLLIERVWGYDFCGDGKIVNVTVQRLREKLEDDPRNPSFIATVRGVGYRFDGKRPS